MRRTHIAEELYENIVPRFDSVWAGHIVRVRQTAQLILLADDMGNGDTSCYGARDIKTPNIDSLAASGIRFTSYYAPAPICSPSRAALITGRYPTRAGMSTTKNIASAMGEPGLPAREITIGELAKTRGYATAVSNGTWVHPRVSAQFAATCSGPPCQLRGLLSHMYYASELWHRPYRNRGGVFEDSIT
jgi:arylsulfatase A-like enzyme